jgi:hypothetical protein
MAEAHKRDAVIGVAKLVQLARDAELVLRLARKADRNGFGDCCSPICPRLMPPQPAAWC